jgi:hypothetical protein
MPKKVAYVGISGPVSYDYRHGTKRVNRRDQSTPNPVLENVSGLLLCYDELIFLSKHFCPIDIWKLPYVKFISSNRDWLTRAELSLNETAQYSIRRRKPGLR